MAMNARTDAITVDVDDDDMIRLPASFLAASPGDRIIVERQSDGKFAIRRVPKRGLDYWLTRFRVTEPVDYDKAIEEGQDQAAREAMGLGGT